MVCTLHYWLPAKIVLRELGEPLCMILFVLLGDLRVDSSSENVPFRFWESVTKSGHSFGAFSGYPVVLAVKRLSRIYVIFHYTKVSEIYHEGLECPTAIRRACIGDRSFFFFFFLVYGLLLLKVLKNSTQVVKYI